MDVKGTLAGLGTGLLVCVALIASLGLGLVVIYGAAWASETLLPWFGAAAVIAFAIELFILLPLAIPRATRGFSSVGMFIASYLFGATLWMTGLLLTLQLWGVGAVIFGLILGGVGVVPIAALAAAFNGMWIEVGGVVLWVVATYASRFGAMSLAQSLEA